MSDYAVIDLATGEKVKEYPTATDAEIQSAIAAAAGASKEAARTSSIADRAALINRVAELHRERREDLADIIVREMGKPREDALGEVDFAADIYGYYADNAERFLADEPVELLEGDGTTLIRRSPYGVLLGIMPWNFPYYQVARFAGPNICAGNTILLKHAPQCPESAAAIQQMFDEAGAPAGVYTNLYATNDQAADVIADPRVGARRCGRGRDRRPQPQEVRAGARRQRSVHPAEHRGSRLGGGEGHRRAHGQHRPVVQCRQAVHRGRRLL